MGIQGLEGLSDAEIGDELDRGARFVYYQYCISVLVMTFTRSSDVFFVRSDESAVFKGLRYTGLSLITGWWGFPWGPIYTLSSLWVNFRGGRDVTAQILAASQNSE